MLPTQQVEGIIPTITTLSIESMKLQTQIMEKEEELKNSDLYQEIQSLKQMLK